MLKILKISKFVLMNPNFKLIDKIGFFGAITSPLVFILGSILIIILGDIFFIKLIAQGLLYISAFIFAYSVIFKGRDLFEKFFLTYSKVIEGKVVGDVLHNPNSNLAYFQEHATATVQQYFRYTTWIILFSVPLFLFIFFMQLLQNMNLQSEFLWWLLLITSIAICFFLEILLFIYIRRSNKTFKEKIWAKVEKLKAQNPEIAKTDRKISIAVIIMTFAIAVLVIYGAYTLLSLK